MNHHCIGGNAKHLPVAVRGFFWTSKLDEPIGRCPQGWQCRVRFLDGRMSECFDGCFEVV